MKRKLLAIIAVLLVVSMACSFLKPKSTPTPEMDQTGSMDNGDQEDDDESPPGDDGDDGGDETTDDEGDQGFSLDSNAFDQLDYYRSNIVMRYEAGDGTLDESIIDTAYIRDPSAQHLIMETNGEGLEMIQIGDQMWLRFGEEWMQTSTDEGSDMVEGFSDFLMDSDDIAGLQDSEYEYLGTDNIDGVNARHYRSEYTQPWMMAFTDDEDGFVVEEGTVDFWVADENDLPSFIVKMEVEMVGTVNDEDATFIWTQVVSDVNKPFIIEPPSQDEVGGLPEGVPMYPNATDVTTIGGMTLFSSVDSVEDVVEFYNDALESAGWENTEEMSLGGMSTSSWEKDGETIQLTISSGEDDDGTSVIIMSGEE